MSRVSMSALMLITASLLMVSSLVVAQPQCISPCSWQSLRDVLQFKPFDSAERDQTLLALQRMATSHVFNDISINSDANTTLPSVLSQAGATMIPMQVDIAARLKAISTETYANDAAMQEAIADVYIPLHDAHTRYNKPAPFSLSVFTMPFQLQHRVVNDRQVVTITMRADWSTAYQNVYGVAPIPDGTNVDGWYVSEINGVPALDVLIEFATNSIGYTKDVGSRLNLAIHGYGDGLGYFSYRSQTAFAIPVEALTFTLTNNGDAADTRNVTIKWLGLYRQKLLGERDDSAANQQQLDDIRQHAREAGHHGDSNDVTLGAEVTSFIDSDNVLVLRIPTFNPTDAPVFIHAIESAVASHQLVGGTRLVIDFRANGGGDICLGYAFIRFLFPTLTQMPGIAPSIVGRYDMAGSDLFSAFASHASDILKRDPSNQAQCAIDPELVGYFTPCAWHDPSTRRQYVNDSFMNPGRSHTRGGIAGKYTQVIQEGCEYQFNAWSPPFHRGYAPDNITLISDGLCGSTCSVVSSFIHLRGLGKTLVLGGIHGKAQMFWSFPGGEVTNNTYIRDLTVKYQLPVDSPLIPPPLPNNATHRFAIRELYPWTDDSTTIPMEFLHFPAYFHQPYLTNFTNTAEFYASAKSVFDVCVDGVGDNDYTCTVKYGRGYYRCINGERSKTICRVTACDSGYYRVNLQDQFCTPCDIGTWRDGSDSTSSLTSCNVCTNAPVEPLLPSHCQTTYVANGNGTNTNAQCTYNLTCDTAALWKYIVTGAVSALLATIIACACARYMASRRQTTDYNDMDRA